MVRDLILILVVVPAMIGLLVYLTAALADFFGDF